MSKYSEISNYNVKYENFTQLIKEFEGYLLGLSKNDLLLFLEDLDQDFRQQYIASVNNAVIDEQKEKFVKELAPKIFDRTTGTYFIKDLSRASQLRNVYDFDKMHEYINILSPVATFQTNEEGIIENSILEVGFSTDADDTSNKPKNFSSAILKYKANESDDSPTKISVTQILPYVNITEINRKEKLDSENKPIKDSNGNPVKEILATRSSEDSINADLGIFDTSDPSRVTPSLNSYVVRTPNIGINARQSSHLPIFLGGIPTLELTRCVPYLDIKIISEEFKPGINEMSMPSFMRFVKQESDGSFSSMGGIGSDSLNAEDIFKEELNQNTKTSFMDIFTSPQTMANANINNVSKSTDYSVYINSEEPLKIKNGFSNQNNNNQVYEPIAPFMSLKSFSVSITGKGTGLLASKSGTLGLTLHDRSRLKDIAPLVASDRFATTKIQIEFGWSHPDGGINSGNPIGQYLNALRDIHVYQVIGSDYKFSDGGAVDITIKLVAQGFRENSRVHCGAGPMVPVSSIADLIVKASKDINFDKNQDKKQVAEIRQKIKVNARSARQLESVMTWDEWSAIYNVINKDKDRAIGLIGEVLKQQSIVDQVNESFSTTTDPNDQSNIIELQEKTNDEEYNAVLNALKAASRKKENKETLLASVFGKLQGLRSDKLDPYTYSLHRLADVGFAGLSTGVGPGQSYAVTEEQMQKDLKAASRNSGDESIATLGKILMNYVGYPMASSCLYDEVQMIFYPLNHHAGGGRVHTTASLPIPLNRLEDAIVEQVNKNTAISVKSFFSMIERKILNDRSLPVYGFSNLLSTLKNLEDKKTDDQKFFAGLDLIKNKGLIRGEGNSDTEKEINNYLNRCYGDDNQLKQKFRDAISSDQSRKDFYDGIGISNEAKKLIAENYSKYLAKEREKVRDEIEQVCIDLYRNDGLSKEIVSEPKFVRPNFTMLFESVPVIDVDQGEELGFLAGLSENLIQGGSLAKINGTGIKNNKTILRIHVYDEEAVASPSDLTLLSTLTDGNSRTLITGNPELSNEVINKMTFFDAKEFVKRNYPTVIYGSAASTVKSISVSSNTSGELSNVLAIEAYGDLKSGQDGNAYDSKFEEVVVFPNTVSLNLAGMPMMSRGQTIFIDFGTNTSLDNIYTVKSVNHNISAGEFNTDLELVPSNMGAISSFRSKLTNAITDINEK